MHGTLQTPRERFLMPRERFLVLLEIFIQIIENKPVTCKPAKGKAARMKGPEKNDHAGWDSISCFSNVTKF
jgi:hypothetical protein